MEYSNYLMHYGKKGMKWGVRRYQNEDGTLTDAGKKRYARDAREKEFNKYDDSIGKYYKTSKKNGRSELEPDVNRYVKEDLERTKRLTDSGSNMARSLKEANEKQIRNKPKKQMDLSNMSDKEMRDKINRAFLEKQYNDMFNPPKVSKGREYAVKIIDNLGTALTLTGSALSIALAINELTGGKQE